MQQQKDIYPTDVKERYTLLKKQMDSLLEGEHHMISNLSNAAALLGQALTHINWVGFYLLHQGELLLGPFQGEPACVHIPLGKGVCGTAFSKNEIQLVGDVNLFAGHIACSSASRSELVIPLRDQHGRLRGVLDIDSPLLERFDWQEARALEEIAALIGASCDWA